VTRTLIQQRIRLALDAVADEQDMPITPRQVAQLAAAATRALNRHRSPIAYRSPDGSEITEAQVRLLALAASGLSNDEIGHATNLSPVTVKTHFRRIFPALGARDRTHAVALALVQGLIKPGDVHQPHRGDEAKEATE
jgi:DNA-binding NarL/FixJ family response regulator